MIYYKYYGENLKSETFLSILLPIIIANTNKLNSQNECIEIIKKYCKFLKKEEDLIEYIFASIIYNSIINDLIKNKSTEYEILLENAKESVREYFLDFKNKKDIIKFQILKIEIIKDIDNAINKDFDFINENKIINIKDENRNIIKNLIKIIYSIFIEDIEFLDFDLINIKKSILSILGEKPKINNIDFISSMANYIFKIRNYNIEKSLYNQKSDPRYLINCNECDEKIDPVFGKIYIQSKSLNDNMLIIKLKSKSGTYNMKFLRNI